MWFIYLEHTQEGGSRGAAPFQLLLLLLFTAIEFSLGGSSPYTSNK